MHFLRGSRGRPQPSAALRRAFAPRVRPAAPAPGRAQDRMRTARHVHDTQGMTHRGQRSGEAVLLRALEALQGERYLRLAERRPANEAFLYGWLANRIGSSQDA